MKRNHLKEKIQNDCQLLIFVLAIIKSKRNAKLIYLISTINEINLILFKSLF